MQQIKAAALAAIAAFVLSACGGGGGSGTAPPAPPTTPPVALPSTITVTPVAKAEVGEPTKFSSSAASVAGLQHRWDFGDGTTSDEAAPSHSFATAGDYEVLLKVSNGAGESREVRSPLSVRAMANVAGLLCSGDSQSGWCWQQPRPSGNLANGLVFVTPTTGWLVGEGGEILKTTDGGQRWLRQTSGTQDDLREARFANDQRGVILGSTALLTTRDGGATWTLGKAPISLPFGRGLQWLSNDMLYLPGNDSAFHSADGGATWTTVPKATALSETGMFWLVDDATRQVKRSTDGGRTLAPVYDFKAEAVVSGFVSLTTEMVARGDRVAVLRTRQARVAAGPSGENYSVFKDVFHRTLDGGATWSRAEAAVGPLGDATRLLAVSPDGMRLLANVYGTMSYVSDDGGKTWVDLQPRANMSVRFVAMASTDGSFIAQDGTEYWLTEDFGKTWAAMTAPFPGYVQQLTRVSADMLVAAQVGSAYSSMVTVDKGRTWRQLVLGPDGVPYGSASTSRYATAAAFLDAKTGFILDPTGKLQATADGGQTWVVRRSDLPLGGGSLHAVDAKTAVFRDKDGRLLRSSDRGMTWVTDPSNARYSKIKFGRAGLGWGIDATDSLVVTLDGGLTWTRCNRPMMSGLNDLHQVDANAWIAVGRDMTTSPGGQPWRREAIAFTRDGGKSWTAATVDAAIADQKDQAGTPVGFELLGVTAVDGKTVWAVDAGGRILRSDDGGVQWKLAQQRLPNVNWLQSIAFADSQRGWAVGGSGAIVATVDGGKTWTRQASGINRSLSLIHIVDGLTLWVSSEDGALLATATGGAR